MPPADPARVRKFIFDYFLAHSVSPVAEEIADHQGVGVEVIREALERLDAARHIRLVPGTSRILMAFPFSAVSTPYQVTRSNGSVYFANCAWDAVAFAPMLREPVQVRSYCAHCNEPLSIRVDPASAGVSADGGPIVYLDRPAASWWEDIITTCANTMVFLRSSVHLAEWRTGSSPRAGAALSVDQTVQLSRPIYEGKFEIDYVRPSKKQLESHFGRLGLTGPFWEL